MTQSLGTLRVQADSLLNELGKLEAQYSKLKLAVETKAPVADIKGLVTLAVDVGEGVYVELEVPASELNIPNDKIAPLLIPATQSKAEQYIKCWTNLKETVDSAVGLCNQDQQNYEGQPS